jgi:hypothetical protein
MYRMCSAIVRFPLPTSSMLTSLWPQKLTELRTKEFPFRISAMQYQYSVMSPDMRHESPVHATNNRFENPPGYPVIGQATCT